MIKNQYLATILLVILMGVTAVAFCSCGNSDDSAAQATKSTKGMSPEELASQATELNKQETNFYGTWVATSGAAKDMYGNLKITINEDGTFDAEVTDEVFSGTWKKIDGGISYTSELMEGKIYYDKTCEMAIEDQNIPVNMEKVD